MNENNQPQSQQTPSESHPTDNQTSQWISVRDRLPEYMQTCIIHTSIGFVTMAQFGGGSKGKEVFVIDQEWHIADHWMPLPKFKIE